jgi:hypothetical protein
MVTLRNHAVEKQASKAQQARHSKQINTRGDYLLPLQLPSLLLYLAAGASPPALRHQATSCSRRDQDGERDEEGAGRGRERVQERPK